MKIRPCLSSMIPYKAGKSLPNAVKLSSNENPLGPSPLALEAIREELPSLHRYPDGSSQTLRKTISQKYNLSQDNIIIGNGSDEILAFIAGAYINEGENGITALNTFSEYTFSLKLFNGEVFKAPLKEGRLDLEKTLSMVNDKTRILFLCNPNNPTGTYFSDKELDNLLAQLPENILVVLDEAYHDFVDVDDYPDSIALLKKDPRIFITRTFSKIYGLAGIRVGYGLGNPEVIDDLFRTKQAFNVNLLAQKAASAALADEDFYKRSIQLVREGKKQIYEGLESLGFSYYPTQSNFICIDLERDSDWCYDFIVDRGIAVRSLTSFGMKNKIRYTFGTREQNDKFLGILKELKETEIL